MSSQTFSKVLYERNYLSLSLGSYVDCKDDYLYHLRWDIMGNHLERFILKRRQTNLAKMFVHSYLLRNFV